MVPRPAPAGRIDARAGLDGTETRLLDLLDGLGPDEWDQPTIVPSWRVRHVAGHLLDTALRRLTIARDGFVFDRPASAAPDDVRAFVDRVNAEGVQVYGRLSPSVLRDMMQPASQALRRWLAARAPDAPAPRRLVPSYAVTSAAVIALLVPFGYGISRPSERPIAPNTPTLAPLPEVIAQLQRRDVATIVEFVDFECPFCRRQQEALAPVLASYGERVRVVRKNVPLSFHEHARDAARAACCADEQGRGEAVAAALFRAEDLTPAGCERVVREAHLDLEAYRACLASRRPDVVIERDLNDARAAGVSGLPTLYVGVERFEGLTDATALRASIERALRGGPVDAASHAPQGG